MAATWDKVVEMIRDERADAEHVEKVMRAGLKEQEAKVARLEYEAASRIGEVEDLRRQVAGLKEQVLWCSCSAYLG